MKAGHNKRNRTNGAETQTIEEIINSMIKKFTEGTEFYVPKVSSEPMRFIPSEINNLPGNCIYTANNNFAFSVLGISKSGSIHGAYIGVSGVHAVSISLADVEFSTLKAS